MPLVDEDRPLIPHGDCGCEEECERCAPRIASLESKVRRYARKAAAANNARTEAERILLRERENARDLRVTLEAYRLEIASCLRNTINDRKIMAEQKAELEALREQALKQREKIARLERPRDPWDGTTK